MARADTRYRTNPKYRQASLKRSYAWLLKAKAIRHPSASLLRRYNLEELAAELGLLAVERQRGVNLTLDLFAHRSPRRPAEPGSPAAA